jgi:hypothetical protein
MTAEVINKKEDNGMGKKEKSFQEMLDDLMSAITFAEAGEHETAREMLGTGSKVLLATKANSQSSNAFKYAINVCKRMSAQLDILYISSVKMLEPSIVGLLAMLNDEGIKWRFIQKEGCMKNQIIDHTEQNSGIMFVVTESSEHLNIGCKESSRDLSEEWENLKCPLVVVSSAEQA